MKLRQQRITKMETILNSIEKKLEQIKQQDYVTYNGRNWLPFCEIDYPSLKNMLRQLKRYSKNLSLKDCT